MVVLHSAREVREPSVLSSLLFVRVARTLLDINTMLSTNTGAIQTSLYWSYFRSHETPPVAACYSRLHMRLNVAYCVFCIAYCVARQCDKNYQFSWLRNITGSKRRLDRPFPWHSVKLFTTNQCYATTKRNPQRLNTNTIDCIFQVAQRIRVFATCTTTIVATMYYNYCFRSVWSGV